MKFLLVELVSVYRSREGAPAVHVPRRNRVGTFFGAADTETGDGNDRNLGLPVAESRHESLGSRCD